MKYPWYNCMLYFDLAMNMNCEDISNIIFDHITGQYYIPNNENDTKINITWLYKYKLWFDHICSVLPKFNMGYIVSNLDDKVIYNSKLLGFNQAELLDKSIDENITPSNINHKRFVEDYKKTKNRTVEGVVRYVKALSKDKTQVPIEIYMQQLPDNSYFAALFKEVNTSTTHDDSIILNMSTIAIVIIDYEGIIQRVNPATIRLSGYSTDDLVGSNIKMLMPEPYSSQHDGYLKKYFATGISTIIVSDQLPSDRTVQLKHKNGTIIPIQLAVKKDPVAKKFIGYVYDMTNRQKEINQKLQFVSAVSHEIKTPLTGIVGLCDNISPDTIDHDIISIKNTADHVLTVVMDILDFSRVESGQFDIKVSQFSLKEALMESIESLNGLLKTKSQTVGLVMNNDVLLSTDKIRLKQIILNVLSNAIKNDDNTGQTIEIVVNVIPNENISIKIKDNGKGMTQDFIENHLFKPFEYRESHRNGGLISHGLGMYIVKTLIEKLQGSISIESIVDVGTTITLQLPIKYIVYTCTEQKLKLSKVTNITGLSHDQIVVIDDNHINVILNQRILKKYFNLPSNPIGFTDPLKALDFLLANLHAIKLVWVDHQMPYINGCDLSKKIREEGFKGIIVAVTAKECYDCQDIDAVVKKPLTIDKIKTLWN